jgi:hypothetical protein
VRRVRQCHLQHTHICRIDGRFVVHAVDHWIMAVKVGGVYAIAASPTILCASLMAWWTSPSPLAWCRGDAVRTGAREDGHVDGEWLDDAFGPDGVRVTFCFTTAVSRYVQVLNGIGLSGSILRDEIRVGRSPWRRFRRQLLRALQKVMAGYVLAIEVDGGKPVYLRRQTRDAIVELADRARAAVLTGGVPGLASFRS